MRTLLILRHAKSSWATPGMDDFDRTLNDRGNDDACRMASWISEQGVELDEIICSPAVRTRTTAKHIKTTLDIDPKLSFPGELYLASSDTLRDSLATISQTTTTAMVIGHNPGLHDISLRLLKEEERSQAGLLRVAFPTTGCALINLPIDEWSEIAWNIGTLSSFMVPKSLNNTQES
ncbi:MAG: histidine phosphatase family protein [Hyphomicrobiales bacterium]